MLTFRVRQNYVEAAGPYEELVLVRQHLNLPLAGAFFRRKGNWDGKIRFMNWVNRRFPYGLWPHVKKFCNDKKIRYRAFTKRRSLERINSLKIGSIVLDKHQAKAANSWLDRGGSGIIWAGAGFGKTEVAAKLINVMLARKKVSRVLFIVNTLDLLDQATERLRARLDYPIGTIDMPCTITVSLIQALDSRIKSRDRQTLAYLKTVDMLVYDEVHHGKSDQSARLAKACPAYYRLGLSARPLYINYEAYKSHDLTGMKADDARVLAFLGPVIIRIPPSVLIKSGRLAQPTIYLYPIGVRDLETENLSWPEARRELIIRNRTIHRVTRRVALSATRAGETTLVVSGGSKELGLNIYKELSDANLNVVYLHGSVKKEHRTASRHKLSKRRLDAIVATTIYDEGVDVLWLRLLVLAYGGLSPYKTEQRLGRGLREKLGRNEAVVIDFMHYANRHLRKHSYARLRQYLEEEQYRVKLITSHHPKYVRNLVGVNNIVEGLPDKKLFMELKHGKPTGTD